jgi:hypothetical protein
LSMHHETRYFLKIDGSRHAMRDAFSGGRALPIVTRKFSVAGPGRAPSPRVAWPSPTSSKSSLTCVGKERIAPGTNKFTPMSEGGSLCFTLFLSSGRQTKKATRGPKRPRMASMPLLSICHSGLDCQTWTVRLGLSGLHRITNIKGRHSGVIGCVTTFSLSTRKIKRLCLNAARLVNAMPAPFLCRREQDSRQDRRRAERRRRPCPSRQRRASRPNRSPCNRPR